MEPLQNIFKINTLSVIRNYMSTNDKLAASLLSKKIQEYLKDSLKVNVRVEEKGDKKIENLEQKLEEVHLTKIIESFTLDLYSRSYDFLANTPSLINLSICIYKGQENINFLKNLTNLKKLVINGEVEGDVSNLVTLSLTQQNKCIQELTLNHCDIKSVEFFTNLKKLVLNRSSIKEPKGKFSSIKRLEYISDDETIALILQNENTAQFLNFESVEEFRLSNVYSKESLKFIERFSTLKSLDLFFADGYSTSLDFLHEKNNLTELYLSNMSFNSGYRDEGIERIVQNIKGLVKLSLINIGLKSLDFLSSLSRLKELKIGENTGITNFTNIGQITELELLDINNCDVKDIKFFEVLICLKKLNISGNKNIKKLEPLTSLRKLEELDISDCNLNIINFFQELQTIKKLNLSNNSTITNFDPLRALNNLESLEIRNCGLKANDCIKDLVNLTYVDLRNNPIDKIGGLYNQNNFMVIKK